MHISAESADKLQQILGVTGIGRPYAIRSDETNGYTGQRSISVQLIFPVSYLKSVHTIRVVWAGAKLIYQCLYR